MNCGLQLLESMGAALTWNDGTLDGERRAVGAALGGAGGAIDGRTPTDMLGGADMSTILIFPAEDDPETTPEPAPEPELEPDATPPREEIPGGLR